MGKATEFEASCGRYNEGPYVKEEMNSGATNLKLAQGYWWDHWLRRAM